MAQLQKIIKVTQEQYDILKDGGTVGSYTGIDPSFIYLVEDTGSGSGGGLIKVTYNDLVILRKNDELIPGCYYEITDYISKFKGAESGNHRFNIILLAVGSHELSESAWATHSDEDDYFDNNNLSAWELKYCLDNDTERFDWAQQECLGIIYYMKDEFGNEAYYDFKNLLMENGAYTFGPDLGIEGYGNNKAYFLEEFNLGYGVTIDPEFCFDTSILKSYSVRGNRVLWNVLLPDGSNVYESPCMQLPHSISFAGENIISNTITLSNQNTYVHSGYSAGIVINSNCHLNIIEGSSGILIAENCKGNHIKQSRDICLRKASYNIFEYSTVVRLGSSWTDSNGTPILDAGFCSYNTFKRCNTISLGFGELNTFINCGAVHIPSGNNNTFNNVRYFKLMMNSSTASIGAHSIDPYYTNTYYETTYLSSFDSHNALNDSTVSHATYCYLNYPAPVTKYSFIKVNPGFNGYGYSSTNLKCLDVPVVEATSGILIEFAPSGSIEVLA